MDKLLALLSYAANPNYASETMVGTARCAVTARKARGTCAVACPTKIVAPLNAARTAQRAVPTISCLYCHLTFSRKLFTCIYEYHRPGWIYPKPRR
jgi:hypothetical protein